MSKLKPWGEEEKKAWFKEQKIQRSYQEEVLSKVESLRDSFEVTKYGALSIDAQKYPLYMLKSKIMDPSKRTILVSGGVHGYETSGVHGALAFFQRHAAEYENDFNFIGVPCISPWGYETINRWNPSAIDPNRSFYPDSPSEECALFLKAVESVGVELFAHFDLHETTDTDNSVFRPALEQRDGIPQEVWDIPDGFYVVGDSANPREAFQRAVIDEVRKVTHIAPCDSDKRIIGEPVEQDGVINYDLKKLNLCAGFSTALYTTTTEVYPDSPKVDEANCVDAQVAAIIGGLRYLSQL